VNREDPDSPQEYVMRTLQALAAVLVVLAAASCSGASQANQEARDYYIAADEVAWNYAPAGTNVFSGAA
jgi:uncharacterized lipoprotein